MSFPFRARPTRLLWALLVVGAIATSPLHGDETTPVEVLYAGSLVTTFERVIVPEFARAGYDVRGEANGSVALANEIRDGLREPDVFISADPRVLDGLIAARSGGTISWYLTFATTRLVLAYSPAGAQAARFASAARGKTPIVDLLETPGLKIGRTDPRVDPKGYRTLIAGKLLEQRYARPGFSTRVFGSGRDDRRIYSEAALQTRLESGDLDGAFVYAPEAIARQLPFVELPREANLGDPKLAPTYANATVRVNAHSYSGAPIEFALTIPNRAPHAAAARAFVRFLLDGRGRDALRASGFTLIAPRPAGDAAAIPVEFRTERG
jgi:molybdate/tungstate transport system substrate-binding protein